MDVKYPNSKSLVLVGDHVEYKEWLFFWKGWQKGRVYYVPGQSKKDENLEHNGLTWVAVQNSLGQQMGILVNPDTGYIDKSVRFVKRSEDGFVETPADFTFGDE